MRILLFLLVVLRDRFFKNLIRPLCPIRCVCVCVCVCVCDHKFVWFGLFLCILMRYMDLWVFFFMLTWMFQYDYLDICCFECLICMCFVFVYLHLFSAIEHVSHGKEL